MKESHYYSDVIYNVLTMFQQPALSYMQSDQHGTTELGRSLKF